MSSTDFRQLSTKELHLYMNLVMGFCKDIRRMLREGTLTKDATDWPLGSDSWLFGLQTKLIPDDGSGQTDGFAPRSYGARTLKAGTLTFNIFLNTTGEVDKTFTPRLYKLD